MHNTEAKVDFAYLTRYALDFDIEPEKIRVTRSDSMNLKDMTNHEQLEYLIYLSVVTLILQIVTRKYIA